MKLPLSVVNTNFSIDSVFWYAATTSGLAAIFKNSFYPPIYDIRIVYKSYVPYYKIKRRFETIELSFLHKLKTKANHNNAPQKSAVELLACHKSVKLLNPTKCKIQRKHSINSEDSLDRKGLDKITANDLERNSSDFKFSSPKLPQQEEAYDYTSSPKIKFENNSLDNVLEFASKIISNCSSEVEDNFKHDELGKGF